MHDLDSHQHRTSGDPGFLQAVTTGLTALVLIASLALLIAIARQPAVDLAVKVAPVVMDYLTTGPHCPGADPGWLGRCSLAPME